MAAAALSTAEAATEAATEVAEAEAGDTPGAEGTKYPNKVMLNFCVCVCPLICFCDIICALSETFKLFFHAAKLFVIVMMNFNDQVILVSCI
jgi:hypothetical protein